MSNFKRKEEKVTSQPVKTIDVLQGEIEDLKRKVDQAKAAGALSIEELSGKIEMESLREQITEREAAIERITLAAMEVNRGEIRKEGETLAEELEKLLDRVKVIVERGRGSLREAFEANIPMRRIQISSSTFVKMEHMAERTAEKFSAKSGPLYEKTFHQETEIFPAIPRTIKRLQEAGWSLCAGEQIIEEPLTADNSILIPTVSVPEVFGSFFDIMNRFVSELGR
jgi:FtsZ-binding cell division protein ZapB